MVHRHDLAKVLMPEGFPVPLDNGVLIGSGEELIERELQARAFRQKFVGVAALAANRIIPAACLSFGLVLDLQHLQE
jgi:hypothetical protein